MVRCPVSCLGLLQKGSYLVGSDTTMTMEWKQQMSLDDVLSIGSNSELFRSVRQVSQSLTCHNCGLSGSRRCARCHQTYYCSVECQKQDWKAHSVICSPSVAKEVDGNKPLGGAGNMEGGYTKAKASSNPDAGNVELNGRRIMLCDLQESALSEGTEFQGYVVEFTSPSNFFVKAFESADNIMKLSTSLQNLYSNPSTIKNDFTPNTGEVCAAKYHQDQLWYRALVYNVDTTMRMAQVLYLDYGNIEVVSLDCVQPMHKDIELLPPCALLCSLVHLTAPPYGWTPECLVEVKRLLVGQKLSIRIVDIVQGELLQYMVDVSLLDTGVHVRNIIIEKGYSFPQLKKADGKAEDPETVPNLKTQTEMPDFMSREVSQDNTTPKPEALPSSVRVGDRFDVDIPVIDNPEMFFCQRTQSAQQLADVMVKMRERYGKISPPSNGFIPVPGEPCAAQFSEDNNWYRAGVVRHLSGDSVLVRYLDFGNTEVLPSSRLRRIDPDLLSIPFQAAQASLAGVKPLSGQWSPEATQAFKNLVMNKILSASVVATCDRILTLKLINESITPKMSISQCLIDAGLAVPSTADIVEPEDVALRWTELPIGQETEVLVCMLRNPGEFYCHINNQTDLQLLNKLNLCLGQYCTDHKSEGYHPAKEDFCGAYYAGDGNWYRAQVKDLIAAGSAKVMFLDYGNKEEVSGDNLCRIPSSFLQLPFQAICCSLSGVKPAGEKWSIDSAKTFLKSAVGVNILAKAIERTRFGYSVELVAKESGTVIADVLIASQCAIREEKSVQMDVNNNRALRPPRAPLLTSKILPVFNSDKGAPTPLDPRPGDCSNSSPPDSLQNVPRDALASVHNSSKIPIAIPKKFIADPTGNGDLHPSNPIVRLPKSIPSPTCIAPHSNNSSPSNLIKAHSSKSTSLIHREKYTRNPHSDSLSPSSQKELHKTESNLTTSGESCVNNSISLVSTSPHMSLFPAPSLVPTSPHINLSPAPSPLVPTGPHMSLSPAPSTLVPTGPHMSLSPAPSTLVPTGPHMSLSPAPSTLVPTGPRGSLSPAPSPLVPSGPRGSLSSAPSPLVPTGPHMSLFPAPSLVPTGSHMSLSPAPSPLVPTGPHMNSSPAPSLLPTSPHGNGSLSPAPSTLVPTGTHLSLSPVPSPFVPTSPHGSLSPTPLVPTGPHMSLSPAPSPLVPTGAHGNLSPCNPDSYNSTPRESSVTALGGSMSSAERQVNLDQSSTSNESTQEEMQKPVNGHPEAERPPSRVSIAQTWKSVDLPLNEAFPACILKVISPDLFYVFPKENRVDVKRLQAVMMEISEFSSKETEEKTYIPAVGDACCAKFTEDGVWYRAVVLDSHDSSAKIAYADYGNIEVLPFSSLLPMKESFLEPPVQLTRCCLADVLPLTETWSLDVTLALNSLLLGAEVLITAKSHEAGIYIVSVDKQLENGLLHLGEKLVMDGLAKSAKPVPSVCLDGSGCCCRDLLKRVEKLEEIILHILNTGNQK
ncbi:tudor domain-containing protein 1 isoform X2 [Engystomops pustulosus]|uniref:tudor domain-containing protein 1 isoform X2 n=1 Tax=Engystomops pustulosus TaxID=76066 RepID=UPI003AFA72D4